MAITIPLNRWQAHIDQQCIDSIPTYNMLLYPMSSFVLKQLDKLRRKFLWECNSQSHKFSLVKWAKVTQLRSQEGLGI